jgi:hypothetical protein
VIFALAVLLLAANKVVAAPITPSFNQGVLEQHQVTKSTINETIHSYDFRTGYELTVGGQNVTPSGNIAPGGVVTSTGSTNGISTTYTNPDLSNKPTYTITENGAPFNYFETLQTPGLTNFTTIQRETIIESTVDSTSTFTN